MANQILLVDNRSNQVANTTNVFYTDDGEGQGTVIDSFTASNPDTLAGVSASYKAYIVSQTGDESIPQKPFQVVVWGEIDLGLGLVNQLIPPGGTLRMEASDTNRIYFTVSGRKV